MSPLLLSRNIAAPRDVLWRYLSTPAGLACWQADSVEGGLDDGYFRLSWPQLGARMDLSVDEIEEGQHIFLSSGDNRLELTVGEGRISLAHHGLHPEDDLLGLESSWQTALSLLELASTRHPAIHRKVHWLFAPISGSAELVHHYFTDPMGLSSWLGQTGSELTLGDAYHLKLDSGRELSGLVLNAGRDVCLRVNEMNDGALALRTLPGPEGQRIVAVGLSSWGSEAAPEMIQVMEQSLGRLARLMQSANN